MNRQETAIGNGSRWLMASVALDEPSLELSPAFVTEIFRCSMFALGQSRRFDIALTTSGLPLIAVNFRAGWHVQKVPGADVGTRKCLGQVSMARGAVW